MRRVAADRPARRYDVDWIRTVALGLLLIFHAISSFQPWADDGTGSYPVNDEHLTILWYPMRVLNVWRIPILFVISGMGACFALNRREPLPFIFDRARRIGLPLAFGIVAIGPLATYLGARQSGEAWSYEPTLSHLWFLLNIVIYALIVAVPGKAIIQDPDGAVLTVLRSALRHPSSLMLFMVPVVVEAVAMSPGIDFVIYGGAHGVALGFVCFILGFLFAAVGDDFWVSVRQARWQFLAAAAILSVIRIGLDFQIGLNARHAIECMAWIFSIMGFGSVYANQPSRTLSYLNPAVYPAYIVHFPIQFGLSIPLFRTNLSPWLKLVILIGGTLMLSLMSYELIARVPYLRELFGITKQPARAANSAVPKVESGSVAG